MQILPWITFALVAAVGLTPPSRRIGSQIWRMMSRLAIRPLAAAAAIFAFTFTLGALLPVLGRAPIPSVHDEFANLHAADTFAHGRLTNPTPRHWEHFETVHELMRPTYASKFPPGEGLMLAVGQWLGSAAIGAVIASALAAVVIFFAMREWISPRWALRTGILTAMHPLFFQWGQSYWGGNVAMIGSGLIFAGAGRWMRRADLRSGILVGLGLCVFAISRPFEGLIVATLLGAVVLWHTHRRPRAMLGPALAMLAVLIPGMMWLAYYNHRITGDFSRLPWVEYADQAMSTPIFVGQSLPALPDYRHDKLRQFHAGYERVEFERQQRVGYLGRLWTALREVGEHWFNPPVLGLLLPCAAIAIARSRAARIGVSLFVGLLLLHPALTPWIRPQYLAAAGAGFVAVIVQSMRALNRWSRFGPALVAGIIAAQFATTGVTIAQKLANDSPPGIARENIVRRLRDLPGPDLVLVRYSPAVQSIFEWVYNDADIEASDIVFARSIDSESDRALLADFADRSWWLLSIDGTTMDFNRLILPATKPLTE
ncbi:MAG: hypothetical protein H7Z14_17715 [Anaerolineae bacterium]|nr:hypothetical protein [Phycisphaerae bacterium]